jgi:hypothetical protein
MKMNQLTKKQVQVLTSKFRFAHGHSPRGEGGWFFEFGKEGQLEHAPWGTFSDAKKWAVNRAVQLGTTRVSVCS